MLKVEFHTHTGNGSEDVLKHDDGFGADQVDRLQRYLHRAFDVADVERIDDMVRPRWRCRYGMGVTIVADGDFESDR